MIRVGMMLILSVFSSVHSLEVANIPISGVGVLADLFPYLESLTVENLHLHVGHGKAILEALKNSNENIIKPIQEPRNLFDPSLFEPLFKLKKLKALHVVSIQAPFFSFPFQNLESLNLNVFQSQSKYDLSSRSGVSPLLKEELAKCVNLVSLQLSFCIDFSRLVNLKSLTVSILEPSDIEKIEKIPSRALERLSLAFYNEEAYNMSDHAKRFPNLNGFADSLIELIVSKNPPIPRNCLSELRLKTVRIWKGHADLVTAISDSSLSIESLLLYFASQSREIRLGDFDLIAKMVNLTSFCFYGQIPFGALSVILHNCQHLIQFELDQFGAEVVLSDEEVAVIITFLNKETLTQLTLNSTRVNSNAMEAIASFPKLESLSVSVDCGQTVSDSWLCPLSKLEGLHTFDLHVHSFLDVDEPNRSFVNREFITLNGFHKAFGNSKKLDFLSVTEATQDIDAADVLKFLPPKAMAYIDNFRSS